MNNQDIFWDLLATKVSQLENLSNHIEIRIHTLNPEGIPVDNQDFHVVEDMVVAAVGEDMTLTIWHKEQFEYLNRFDGEMEGDDFLDTLIDEFDMTISFTQRHSSYEVFDWIEG